MYFAKPDRRKFNIALGTKIIKEHIDLVGEVGKYAMHQEYVEFELKNNKIYVDGEECQKAYDSRQKKVKLVFKKTIYDNPKVDGIILF